MPQKLTQMKTSETEQKIKKAASIVFKQKGFKETRTRDIAEQADVNLALINYYYKSKEALFNEIMTETLQSFQNDLYQYFNDPKTSASEKISIIANNYISLLQKEPNLPLFMIKEVYKSSDFLGNKLIPDEFIENSVFQKQLLETGKCKVEIENLIINTMSLIVFPIICKPLIQVFFKKNEQEYFTYLEQRRKEIPIWISLMFKLK